MRTDLDILNELLFVSMVASENNNAGSPCWGHGKNPIFTCFDPAPHMVRPRIPCYRFTTPHVTHGTPHATHGVPDDTRVPRFYLICHQAIPTPTPCTQCTYGRTSFFVSCPPSVSFHHLIVALRLIIFVSPAFSRVIFPTYRPSPY